MDVKRCRRAWIVKHAMALVLGLTLIAAWPPSPPKRPRWRVRRGWGRLPGAGYRSAVPQPSRGFYPRTSYGYRAVVPRASTTQATTIAADRATVMVLPANYASAR